MTVQYIAVLFLLFSGTAFGFIQDAYTKVSNKTMDECFAGLPPSVTVDVQWAISVPKWYFLAASLPGGFRLIRLQMSQGKFDECLLGSPCLTVAYRGDQGQHHDVKGCNGIHSSVINQADGDQTGFSIFDENEKEILSGRKVTLDTDNKTFTISLKCWKDGVQDFVVYSAIPELPQKTWARIFKVVTDHGFNLEQRIGLFHSPTCPLDV